jgi:hypothetical protein
VVTLADRLHAVQERVYRGGTGLDPLREAIAIHAPVIAPHVDRLGRAAFHDVYLGDGPIEEYFERWRDHDAFTSAIAQQLIRSGQTVSLEDIYPRLEPNRRRYVDKFLSSHRISAHVMVRLETRGAVDGL